MIRLYMTGIITIVRKVEAIRPAISETAIGANKLLPERASGIRPITVVPALNIIALKRLSTASRQAVFRSSPLLRASLIYSMSRMPF